MRGDDQLNNENDDVASQQTDKAAQMAKSKAKKLGNKAVKKATQPLKDKARKKAKDATVKALKKAGKKTPGKLGRGLDKLADKVAKMHKRQRVRDRIKKRIKERLKKIRQRAKKLLAKMLAHLVRFFLAMWPYILGGFAVLALFLTICAWFLNRDLTQRFASYNFQEDTMGAENPYSIDRDGNYVTQAKNMSKGNKMYFVYYAYNAQNSWYVANVKINPKTKKEEVIDWQNDDYVKQILGMKANEVLKDSLERSKGGYGSQKLLRGNTPLYNNVISQRLGSDAKDAVESFTMNTNMLYLLDQSLNRPNTGGTNKGFYFSEQFIKPMYTGPLFNYKSLIDRNTGKWNAKSWVMDTQYRPKKKSLEVTSELDNALHEPGNKILNKVAVKKLHQKLKKMGEAAESAALPGPIQKYYLYDGFKDASHPYPYAKDLTTKGYRPESDTTSTDPSKRSKKEIEELKKKANDPKSMIKDYVAGAYDSYERERKFYQELQEDLKEFENAKKPTKPDFNHFAPKKVKVTGDDIAHKLGYGSYKDFKQGKHPKGYKVSWWQKALDTAMSLFGQGAGGVAQSILNIKPVQEKLTAFGITTAKQLENFFSGADTYINPIAKYNFSDAGNGNLKVGYTQGNKVKYLPLFRSKRARKEVEDAVKSPKLVYRNHKLQKSQRIGVTNYAGRIFDENVNPKMKNYSGKLVPWGKNQHLLTGWINAWRAYYVALQKYNYGKGSTAKKFLAKEHGAYKKATMKFVEMLGVKGKSAQEVAAKKIMETKHDPGILKIVEMVLGSGGLNQLLQRLLKAGKQNPALQATKIKAETPNTHSGANLKYTNGVWNYGFGSIIKFAQFPISYAERIDWDTQSDSTGAGDIGGVDVKGNNKTAMAEAYNVANALGEKLNIDPSLIFGQMYQETGFHHVAARYNLSGVKWNPGDPSDEKGSMSPEGNPYRAFKSASEYARIYGNTIKMFLNGKHPRSAQDYVNCLTHGPGGLKYFTDPNVGGYIAGIASGEKLYKEYKSKNEGKSQAPSPADLENLHKDNADQNNAQRQTNPKDKSVDNPNDKSNASESDINHDLPIDKNGNVQVNDKDKNRKISDVNVYMTSIKPAKGPGSSVHGEGGMLKGSQYGFYDNGSGEPNMIVDGDQSRFKNKPTLNQHKEYFLTGATTPVGSVDLTKTLYYGRKDLPASYKPFNVLQKGNHGLPNKDWNDDKGKALGQQIVYSNVVQRKLWDPYSSTLNGDHVTVPKNAIIKAFPAPTQGAVTNPNNATHPSDFRPNNGRAKKANGNAQPNGTTMYNQYHVVMHYSYKVNGKWVQGTRTETRYQQGSVTLISDAPQIDSETWKAITAPAIKQFQDKNHGAANIETNDFSLHGTEYFRQYMMNYATYTPDAIQDAEKFELTKEINMFQTGSTYESDMDKRKHYDQLTKFFDKATGQSAHNSKNGETQGPASGNSKLQATQKYQASINKYSEIFGIDPNLIASVIMAESGGDPGANNSSGAYGLMQSLGTGNPVKVYDFKHGKYITWTKLTASQLRGHPDKQIYNGTAEMAYRLANAKDKAGFDSAMNGYGGGAQDGWGKFYPGDKNKIWWMGHKGNRNTKYYTNGKSEGAGTSGNGSEDNPISSAVNGAVTSVIDNVKGYLSNFSASYPNSKETIMGSIWQSMFHRNNFSTAVDIWTYDERNNNMFNAINMTYSWFDNSGLPDYDKVTFKNDGRLGIRQTALKRRLDEKANTNIGIINNGAQMYRWKKYVNNLSYDEFKQVMRAWCGVLETQRGRKTLYDDAPDTEVQMSYDLDNDIVNTFADLYLKGGALDKRAKLKKVLTLAFGSNYNINVVGKGLPQLADGTNGDSPSKKSLNATDDDSDASTLDGTDGGPASDYSPGASFMNDFDREQLEAYEQFNNTFNSKDANAVAGSGSFNGKNVMFKTSAGENVYSFASGKIIDMGNDYITIEQNNAHIYYEHITPDKKLKKDQKVKSKQKIGTVSTKGQLIMGLQMPNGHEASLDINQDKLARIVKPADYVQQKEQNESLNGSNSSSNAISGSDSGTSDSGNSALSDSNSENSTTTQAPSPDNNSENSDSNSNDSDSNSGQDSSMSDRNSNGTENLSKEQSETESNQTNISNESDMISANKNQTLQYDDDAAGQYLDPSLLYEPEDKGDDSGSSSDIVAEAEKWLNKFPYDMSRTATHFNNWWESPHTALNLDCSSFVWMVLKRTHHKVPDQIWTTAVELSDMNGAQRYFKKVSMKNAKAGDIFTTTYGDGGGHTVILASDWKGKDTVCIDEDATYDKVGKHPFGRIFNGEYEQVLSNGAFGHAKS